MLTQELIDIALLTLTIGKNPRMLVNYAVNTMCDAIAQDGLETRPEVWTNPETGQYEIIRGHRRREGLLMLQATDPKKFDSLFPNEQIPVLYFPDITASEVMDRKLDEGNTVGLSHRFELQTCVNWQLDEGKTESEIITKLAGLMDRIIPAPAGVKKDLREFDTKIDIAEITGNTELVEKLKKDKAKRLETSRHGTFQNLAYSYKCPNIVMAAMEFNAIGSTDDKYKDEYMPSLTQAQTKKLYEAFKVDLEELNEKQLPKFSKVTPGPSFRVAWDEIVVKEQDKADDKAAGVKERRAKNKTDLDKEVSEGKWLSQIAQQITRSHSGHDVSGLKMLDIEAYSFERVKDIDPKLFKHVMETAAEADKLQNEATAEPTKTTNVEAKTKAKTAKPKTAAKK